MYNWEFRYFILRKPREEHYFDPRPLSRWIPWSWKIYGDMKLA